MGLDLGQDDIEVEPLTGVRPKDLASAKSRGETLKYLGSIRRETGRIRAEVKVRAIAAGHPLFGVDGTNKGVTFLTDTMGAVTVTGGEVRPAGRRRRPAQGHHQHLLLGKLTGEALSDNL